MSTSPPRTRPTAPNGRRAAAALAAVVVALVAGGASAARGDATVIHAFIDPQGLPNLYRMRDDGVHVMPLPQFRLFDAEGRPLWVVAGKPRGFQRELERRMREPLGSVEGRTFGQEARYFVRRGGLPLNLTALPETEFTIVEYWTGST